MARERYKHLGGFLFTVAFETGAALMALRAAWLMVALLVIAGAGSLALAYLPEFQQASGIGRRIGMIALGGMIVCGVGFIAFAGLYFWPKRYVAAPQQEAKVLIECVAGVPPNRVPESGRLSVLPLLSSNEKAIIGPAPLEEFFSESPPGTEWNTTGDPHQVAYQCGITNYDSAPLFAVDIELFLRFERAVKDPNGEGIRNGSVILEKPYRIRIPRIDVGPNSAFVFYTWNMADDEFVWVSLPKEISAQRLGSDTRQVIRVIEPPITNFWLPPQRRQGTPPVDQNQKSKRDLATASSVTISGGQGVIAAPGNRGVINQTNTFGQKERKIDDQHAAAISTEARIIGANKFVVVDYSGGTDPDTNNYATRIWQILRDAGWKPVSTGVATFLPVGGGPLMGIHILAHSEKVPVAAGQIAKALSDNGVDVVFDYITFPAFIASDDTVGLAVGRARYDPH